MKAEPPAKVKGELKSKNESVKVKAEQKDQAEKVSHSGRLQTSSSTPIATAQMAARSCKFTSIPGKGPCPECGRILSKKSLSEHLRVQHGAVKSNQFPNCWPD